MRNTAFDALARPTKVDCARLMVQLELQLATLPAPDHPEVVRTARRLRLPTLLNGASLAASAMASIQETYGSFPRPAA